MILSAGFDPAAGDLLGPMEVSSFGFASMLRYLLELANGKLVAVLEGGYALGKYRSAFIRASHV